MNSKIRNFSIIAHIDHGKSTLSDRLIHLCGGLATREMKAQVLDSMELERERGITIKAQSVTLDYKAKDGETYQLNFIDTPGHVDFSYEVSRSLAACEGAMLIVDAAQGVEAQTVANCYTATMQGLEILPVLNKIDLPQSDPERVCQEIEDIIGVDTSNALKVSAKTGQGVAELLEAIVQYIPPPTVDLEAPLQALIIDSWFDPYQGVVSLVRVKNGILKVNDRIQIKSTGQSHLVTSLGVFRPHKTIREALNSGEVGFIIAGIKEIKGAPVGDTIGHQNRAFDALPGFCTIQPKVFAGIFPVDTDDFLELRQAIGKLQLNDASLFFEEEKSAALGNGFRCGFLGTLHLEVCKERLEREYNLSIIVTSPSVRFRVIMAGGDEIDIDNPGQLPAHYSELQEPIVIADLLVPPQYVGSIITLCSERRGRQLQMRHTVNQVALQYELPMVEIVGDFFDELKSMTKGYASIDYQFDRFEAAELVKLDIMVNGECIDPFAQIVHKDKAYSKGKELVDKLQKLIPRQMFEIAIQAAIGSKIIARSSVKALRKNVIAKCYGGDISRKRKLLEKQKEGKKKMKRIGKVDLPQDAFLAALTTSKK